MGRECLCERETRERVCVRVRNGESVFVGDRNRDWRESERESDK